MHMVEERTFRFKGAAARALRESAGIRQSEMAEAIRCAYRHLTQAEAGTRELSIELTHRYARVLTQHHGRTVDIVEFYDVTAKAAA